MEEVGMMEMVMPIMMMAVMAGVVQTILPGPAVKNQCCPICGECYSTYDQLYNHFTTAHPAEPIDIIWE